MKSEASARDHPQKDARRAGLDWRRCGRQRDLWRLGVAGELVAQRLERLIRGESTGVATLG